MFFHVPTDFGIQSISESFCVFITNIDATLHQLLVSKILLAQLALEINI